MLYDPGDCVYHVNATNIGVNNQQVLGDAIVATPGAGNAGQVLTTVRKFGAGATGVYNKYHKRNHVDFFYVDVFAS